MNDQRPVGYVSQDFLDGKWALDHIAKSDEGQISRTIPVFTKPPQASEQRQNVTQLVEALESAYHLIANHSGETLPTSYASDQMDMIDAALAALAAYRKGAQP